MQQPPIPSPHSSPSPTPQSQSPSPITHPQRITQLQCYDIDSQITFYFTQSFNDCFKYMPKLLEFVYNQIELLVGLMEWRLTVGSDLPHSGDLLQNIRYKNGVMTNKIKLLYLLLTVILPYIKKKLYAYLMKDPTGWKDKLISVFNFVDKVLMALNLINSSIFIRYGKYRNLTQRILKIPMQFIHGESARILDFTLMNRKIIWSIYQLFLKTVLPYAHDVFGPTLKNIFYLSSYEQPEQTHSNNCVYCEDTAKMPMKANCEHLACYYCYMVNHDGEEGEKMGEKESCRRCGVGVVEWKKMF